MTFFKISDDAKAVAITIYHEEYDDLIPEDEFNTYKSYVQDDYDDNLDIITDLDKYDDYSMYYNAYQKTGYTKSYLNFTTKELYDELCEHFTCEELDEKGIHNAESIMINSLSWYNSHEKIEESIYNDELRFNLEGTKYYVKEYTIFIEVTLLDVNNTKLINKTLQFDYKN